MALIIEQNKSLKAYNTFGIDVNAPFFTSLIKAEDTHEIISYAHKHKLNLKILGSGSNVLIRQLANNTLVVHNKINHIQFKGSENNDVLLHVGAGVNWHAFVCYALEHDWFGIENLALIPGTCGAAPMQNIGAYGVEVESVIDAVYGVNIDTNQLEVFSKSDCLFGYRTSIFKTLLRDKFIITAIDFRLKTNSSLNLNYNAIEDELAKNFRAPYSHKQLATAVVNIRQSKLPDPKVIGNAGSFFKNPTINQELAQSFLEKWPNAPLFDSDENRKKLSAAWLIEQSGYKGITVGEAATYHKHALVLINKGNATGDEIWNLAKSIQAAVFNRFEVHLEPEINIW